jgi:hypothetical protein
MIEYVGGQYVVTDLPHSRYGTFVGIQKVDCRKTPQRPLSQNELLFLGRELFVVDLPQPERISVVAKKSLSEGAEHTAAVNACNASEWECSHCYHRQPTRPQDNICPECGTYDG